jgi:hypothetical protein
VHSDELLGWGNITGRLWWVKGTQDIMAGLCHDRIERPGFWSYDTVHSCKWVPTFQLNMGAPPTYHP